MGKSIESFLKDCQITADFIQHDVIGDFFYNISEYYRIPSVESLPELMGDRVREEIAEEPEAWQSDLDEREIEITIQRSYAMLYQQLRSRYDIRTTHISNDELVIFPKDVAKYAQDDPANNVEIILENLTGDYGTILQSFEYAKWSFDSSPEEMIERLASNGISGLNNVSSAEEIEKVLNDYKEQLDEEIVQLNNELNDMEDDVISVHREVVSETESTEFPIFVLREKYGKN